MEEVINLIERKSSIIAEKIVERQFAANPAYWDKFDHNHRKISIRDAAYHLPFLSEAIVSGDKSIFTDYVLWVKELFQGINLPDTVMINTLKHMGDVLKEELPEQHERVINEYIEAGLQQMMNEPVKHDTYIDETVELGKLTRNFINALLEGDRNKASKLILDAAENGVPVQDIYLKVFQKSQYEIGRLWLSNKISIAKEHFCTAATQMIMSQLYPYIFSTQRVGKRIVTASVGGELHEIGVRMVADIFEMHGWDSYYLGANMPTKSIIDAIDEHKADVVGLSVAMPYHRSKLKEVIEEIRKSDVGHTVKIMIGGNALNQKSDTWEYFNADGYAPDALKAVDVANDLTTS